MTGIQYTSPSGDGLCRGRLFDVMPLRDSIVTSDGNELARDGVQNVNVGTAGRAPLSIETREMTGAINVVVSTVFDRIRNMRLNSFGSDYVSQSVPIIHHISVSTVDERGCVHTSPLITGSLEETSCSRAICSPGVAGPGTTYEGDGHRENTHHTGGLFRYSEGHTPSYIDLGDCHQQCQHCGCLFWYSGRIRNNNYGRRVEDHLCCGGGKIYMPSTPDPLVFIQQLLTNSHFMEHIRAYNQMFAMTSFGAKVDDSVNNGKGPYVFDFFGQIYHWIGSLCPEEGHHPRFLQLYIYDTQAEVSNIMRNFGGREEATLNPGIVEGLIHVLDEHNGLVGLFRTTRDGCNAGEIPGFKIRLYNNGGARGYELPDYDVLGGIVFEDGSKSRTDFDVIIEFRGGLPQRINKLHQSYMSLQFPLLFVFGEPGYYPELLLKPKNSRGMGQKVTMNAYYKYQLHPRVKGFGLIFKGGRLFQEYVVVAFCAIEQSPLDFIRKRYRELRSDYLLGLYDAISQGDREGIQAGSMVMLPRTFTGGPRYMYSHYLDALAICLTPGDRADIVCRVFQQKVNDFLRFLKDERPFAYVIAFLYTIEFQKRGLPHCHTLLWVDSSNKIKDATQIDDYISAELPDPVEDPIAYKVVTELMMHGPCGVANPSAVCTEKGICNKGFPKMYNDKTFFDINGHTHYRRRQTEVHFIKGESRIFDYPIHRREPTVQILNVHLENMQRVNFRKRDRLDVIVNMPDKKKTTLTEWYVYNNEHTDVRHLTYLDFPSEFVWYADSKSWHRRVIRTKKSIGRLTYVHPNSGDLFYFRMLLSHKKGCKSPIEVRTVNGQVLPTYRAACEALGLLGDDKEWDIALEESSVSATSAQLRTLFAQIVVYCSVADPRKLWEKHWEAMKDDIPGKVSEATCILNYHLNTPELQGHILYELEATLNGFRKRDVLLQASALSVPKLNEEQKQIYSLIMNAAEQSRQEMLFVYGQCGTRKTFLWKTIISSLRSQGKIVLVVASSGIAFILLPAGQTAHSRFKLPLELTDESICHAKKHCQLGNLLIETNLIIWDEAPMNDKHFKVCTLKQNMRLFRSSLSDEERERSKLFAEWLLDVGNGEIGYPDKDYGEDTFRITVPQEYCIAPGEQAAVNSALPRRRNLKDGIYDIISGNVVEFTMFDDLAKQFNKQEIDKLPRPVIIAVSSCRVTRYRDVQLVETPATHYYVNPRFQEASDAYKMFKEKYNQNPPLQVINYRYQDPEQEKVRNRQTLYTLLQQNPATFKDVRFTCDAMITSFNERRSWSYPSCNECKKLSTKRNGIDTCEDHGKQIPPTYRYNFTATVADGTATAEFTFFTEAGQKIVGQSCSDVMQKFEASDKTKLPVELVNTIGTNHIFQIQFSPNTHKGAGRFIVNDVLDIQTTHEQQDAGLMSHASINKDKGLDTQLATGTVLTIQDSTSKDSSMPAPSSKPLPPTYSQTTHLTLLYLCSISFLTAPHTAKELSSLRRRQHSPLDSRNSELNPPITTTPLVSLKNQPSPHVPVEVLFAIIYVFSQSPTTSRQKKTSTSLYSDESALYRGSMISGCLSIVYTLSGYKP
ncbi:DNA helicase [Tanacetum coccineum]